MKWHAKRGLSCTSGARTSTQQKHPSASATVTAQAPDVGNCLMTLILDDYFQHCSGQPRGLVRLAPRGAVRAIRPSGQASALRVRAAWASVFVSDRNEIQIKTAYDRLTTV
eukprot:6214551-Pleurochrysis_carterae.AAC.2